MAYKSRVSNKYFGSTYEGRPNVARVSPLGELAQAINRNVQSFEAAGANYIQGKKEDAVGKLNELYSQGKSYEEITKSVLNNEFPELSSMYAESAVQSQVGRFAAAEAIAKIKKSKEAGEYDYTTDNLVNFHKKFVQEYDLNNQDDNFNLGFAAVFNQWQSDEKIEDAKLKGTWHNTTKMSKAMTLLDTVTDISQIIPMVNSLAVELPKLEGEGKRNFFFSTQEQNALLLNYANKLYLTATTQDQLERASNILNLDRGIGKGGNELGSLINSNEKAMALFKSIEEKKISLANHEYTLAERERTKEQRDGLFTIFNMDTTSGSVEENKAALLEQDKAIEALGKKYPSLIPTINNIRSGFDKITEDRGGVLDLRNRILLGEFNNTNFNDFLAEVSQYTNSWDTISKLTELQQSSSLTARTGFTNPTEDTRLKGMLSKIETQIVNNFPKIQGIPDDSRGRQAINDLIIADVESEYLDWLADNMQPPASADDQTKLDWFTKQKKWLDDTYQEKLKLYSSQTWQKGISEKLSKDITDTDFDLDELGTQYINTKADEYSKLFTEDAVTAIVTNSQNTLRSAVTVLKNEASFKKLMQTQGIKGVIDEDTMAREILTRLNIDIEKDYADEILKVEDNIRLTDTINNLGITNFTDMENFFENNYFDGLGDEDITRFRNNVTTQLENILGLPPSPELIRRLSPEAQSNLAKLFNITDNQFQLLIDNVFGK